MHICFWAVRRQLTVNEQMKWCSTRTDSCHITLSQARTWERLGIWYWLAVGLSRVQWQQQQQQLRYSRERPWRAWTRMVWVIRFAWWERLIPSLANSLMWTSACGLRYVVWCCVWRRSAFLGVRCLYLLFFNESLYSTPDFVVDIGPGLEKSIHHTVRTPPPHTYVPSLYFSIMFFFHFLIQNALQLQRQQQVIWSAHRSVG